MKNLAYALTSLLAAGALTVGMAGAVSAQSTASLGQSTASLTNMGSSGSLGSAGSSETRTFEQALLLSNVSSSNSRAGFQPDASLDRVAGSFAHRARSGEFQFTLNVATVRDRSGIAYVYRIGHGAMDSWSQVFRTRNVAPGNAPFGVDLRSDNQFVYVAEYFRGI